MIEFDLEKEGVRGLKSRLQALAPDTNERKWSVLNPMGAHAIAVGLTQPITVEVQGHAGFYCGGMNQHAEVIVNGHAGPGVAETDVETVLASLKQSGENAWLMGEIVQNTHD